MKTICVVYEMGVWEFCGTYAECLEYVSLNEFKDSFFVIK